MSNADDPLGPELARRLREELDAIQPSHPSPRYLATGPRPGMWRLAPAGLAAGVLGILALSAFFATGSPNPAVWTERVMTVIETKQAPSPQPSPAERHQGPGATPSREPSPEPSAEPSERPEPSEQPGESPEPAQSPEPHESPEPSDGGGHSGSDGSASGSSGRSPEPSPSPGQD